jgi:hypothetical protein
MFAGWSPIGIAALVAITGGVVLLVLYAARRGLIHRELEGIEAPADGPADPGMPAPGAPSATPGSGHRSRTLGALGAVLLAVGLALGVLAAYGSWFTDDTTGGSPGLAPQDCAQTWQGCPRATP